MSSIRGAIQRRYLPVHITQMAVERNHNNLIGAEWTQPYVSIWDLWTIWLFSKRISDHPTLWKETHFKISYVTVKVGAHLGYSVVRQMHTTDMHLIH